MNETPTIAVEDPRTADVVALLEQHLAFAREVTPPGHVHALDLEGLCRPSVTFCCVRSQGALLAVGALRWIDADHVEIKSMHTARAARGRGLGEALLDHLLGLARAGGAQRVSLETGTMDAFAPARRLYERAGFRECEPFADYARNEFSVCMTRKL